MKTSTLLVLLLLTATALHAQTAGNQSYENRYRGGSSNGRLLNYLSDSTFLIEAQVLLNAKADQFVAVFGVSEEAATVEECNRKIDKRIEAFMQDVKGLGVASGGMFVDMIAQSRIYDYKMEASVAKEYASGFELKKNISIQYKDHDLIEKLMIAASKHEIFDLVKADYLVSDLTAPYNTLLDRARQIIADKLKKYEALTGRNPSAQAEIFLDDFKAHYPSDAYKQYQAYESGDVRPPSYNSGVTVMSLRKSRTFYFDSIDLTSFDAIINPVILEPAVQFTLTLAVKYQVGR